MTIKPGAFRFNTDSAKLEYYDGNQWVNITITSPEQNTGGTRGLFAGGYKVPGTSNEMNTELAKAGRVADFLELGELFARDALERNESCGGHFREESVELDGAQKGEAKRNDKDYAYVTAWEYTGEPENSKMHKEELEFNDIELKQRSYK